MSSQSEPIYLITGVTGEGGAAARELLKQGRRVRGLRFHADATQQRHGGL
jgi:GDP-D-mannose dehydratase